MAVEHSYDVSVCWDRDRKGTLSSSVLDTTIEVATPPEFPKGMEGIWSPEHLFAAAVNSCLMTTFLAIAEHKKLDFVSFNSYSSAKLEMTDGKYMISEIILSPVVIIKDEAQKELAEQILHKSEAACLISASIKSTIVFRPVVTLPSVSAAGIKNL
ncbi:OsmC family protein [Filimonas effusa]|uniref:OsmC family peroxiredoxin n=1 Tax=Filimonas effusa TaxID=2508721 RepID=A0A4Q1D827_9BACT|nr:OsmC family protein [Filimonas effusa]RXK85474.1 OsmC family peroxiredoxin [Filimonas effusa]